MMTTALSNAQPYLILGARRSRALEERVRQAAEAWVQRWTGIATPISVAIESTEPTITPTSLVNRSMVFGVRAPSGQWLAQIVPSQLVTAWALGVSLSESVAEPGPDSIACQLEQDILESLWHALYPLASTQGQLRRLAPAELDSVLADLGKRRAQVMCRLAGARPLSLNIVLSAEALMCVLGERRTVFAGEKLGSRRAALRETPVFLDCELGSIEIPVRDLHALKVGDVIVTDIMLESRAEVRVRGRAARVAAASLGTSAGQKAIKVETTNRGTNR